LTSKSVNCDIVQLTDGTTRANSCVLVAGASSEHAKGFPQPNAQLGTESVFLAPGHFQSTPAILVSGTDPLGYVYGLLELAERVEHGSDPDSALHLNDAIEEKPANDVRCVSRYFCSEIADKPWYYDKDFWRGYLDGLVAARFNRFCFAYGLEYDFPRGVTNDYLHLPYPYLVKVPGYESVRVVQLADPEGNRLPTPVPLSDEERQKNFEALRFIAAETAANHADERRQEMRERLDRVAEKLGIERNVDIQDLMYRDDARADVATWLNDHGWRATAQNSDDEMRRLDRWVEGVPSADDKQAFSQFVTAERA